MLNQRFDFFNHFSIAMDRNLFKHIEYHCDSSVEIAEIPTSTYFRRTSPYIFERNKII